MQSEHITLRGAEVSSEPATVERVTIESGAKGFSIPMPTTASGFTQAQLAEIRKARERNTRDGLRFVGDYR